jgi:hypothetical protein
MPINQFSLKKNIKLYPEKCKYNYNKFININVINNNKTVLKFNTYGLKSLKGLSPFYITKL